MNTDSWNPYSWRKKRHIQQPHYAGGGLHDVVKTLQCLPPLVARGEVDSLRGMLCRAECGNAFILQGGDCVERFADNRENIIINKIKILLQMSMVLTHAFRKPVIKIGRIAGQYFKPRSNEYEEVSGKIIPVYRGDGINDFFPDKASRQAAENRLLRAYYASASTLNYIRAVIKGGFADLHNPYNWNLHSIEATEKWEEYREIVENILDSIHFMESFGGIRPERVGEIDFYASHEGLHLEYESALIRKNKDGRYYNLGSHMTWIGNRTRDIDSAHVELFRGIENPIGIKIDGDADPDELREIHSMLNPRNENGRILFITRIGAGSVLNKLPPLIQKIKGAGCNAAWLCDPMHGNTIKTESSLKTRRFGDILEELKLSFSVHRELGSILSGVHFELTADDVTECTGGLVTVRDNDLPDKYETYCDPRLNYSQSMEMAFLLSRLLKENQRGTEE